MELMPGGAGVLRLPNSRTAWRYAWLNAAHAEIRAPVEGATRVPNCENSLADPATAA